ncbi:hypothetical protein VaNZ11_014722 [Volvox africanus]|uniref:Protein kinase domain-containing protein n=1 Tax=Volvox africanus TaxID=51714 RepID=A0ABQ5SJ49_9CHLO|nr:hypothetical protein VaNZ11_014722 [Volvox africanus]
MGIMGLSEFFSCLCGVSSSSPKPPSPQHVVGNQKAEHKQDGCQEVITFEATEELLRLQRELSALSGLGFKPRLTRLLATISAYSNAETSLFGVVGDGHFILLATSHASGAHKILGTEPRHKELLVLQRMFSSQRPSSEEYRVRVTGSISSGDGLHTTHAIPLFGGPTVTGALLLEAVPGSEVSGKPLSVVQPPYFLQKRSTRARRWLFSSPTLLHQLSLAVSMSLGVDGEQLEWLARALHRVANCDSMNSLVWELCEDIAAHVKRRFIVEANVRAALMPRTGAPLGLLFHAHPCSNRAKVQDPSGGLSSRFGSSSTDHSSLAPGNIILGPMPPPCTSKLGLYGSLVSRHRPGAQTPSSTTGSDYGAATSRASKLQPSVLLGLSTDHQVCASGRVSTLQSDAAGGAQPIDPNQAPTATLPQLPSRTIVIQLPPHIALETPSASLHAQAFPLKHSALQALAWGPSEGMGSRASSSQQPPLLGNCIEDVALFLQDVHNPSRDVCLLLGALHSAGQLGLPRTLHTAPVTLPPSPPQTVNGLEAGCAMGSGGWGSNPPTSLQSLVLVGLRLGESVLSFYLCFSKRLPGELLLAIRDSCDELFGEVFVDVVRAKMKGSLAAEYEALRSTTPGHFAVLRSPSVNALVNRPRSQGSVSARAARLIAPPRIPQANTFSGCNESAATPTAAAAAAIVVGAEEGAAYANSPKLLHRASMEMRCSSPGEDTRFTTTGQALPVTVAARTVSFTAERGSAAGGSPSGRASAFKPSTCSSRCMPCQRSRELTQQVPMMTDDLVGVLLQMRQSETVCSQGDLRSASLMTITGVDAVTSARQQLDFLVTSIQTTMTTEVNGAMLGFFEDLESLELMEVLGKGGGGVVYKGRLGTQEVAVKVMELPDLDMGEFAAAFTPQQLQGATTNSTRSGPNGNANSAATEQVPNPASKTAMTKEQLRARRALLRNAMEMAVQGRVSHPNLIQVYATYTNVLIDQRTRTDGSSYNCLVPAETGIQDLGLVPPSVMCCAIVAEFADCGSLAAALSSRVFPRFMASGQPRPQLDLRGVYMTLLDVALALRHLHSLNFVHRDVKPANLLLKSNPRDYRGFTVKLSDFGFVLHLTQIAEDGTRYVMVDQACGTVTHMAPELLPGKAHVEASADIYSFGILMWELVSGGARPFPHLHPDHIPRHVYKGARPIFGDLVPLSYRGLAQACWAADPHRRPKAADIVTMITTQMQELD